MGGSARQGRRLAIRAAAAVFAVLFVCLYSLIGDSRVTEPMSEDLRTAIRERRSGVTVTLEARVVDILPDDNEGIRHQRLLLVLPEPVDGFDTVLIAHNIDEAPRVPCVEGDTITVHGRYKWNDLGGLIHWTHRDREGIGEDGWIEFRGQRYD